MATILTIIALFLMFTARPDTLDGLWRMMWSTRLIAFNNMVWFVRIFMGYTSMPMWAGVFNIVAFILMAVLEHKYRNRFKLAYWEEYGDDTNQ